MRIQSIQNQQTQNRPNFSAAHAFFIPEAPKLYNDVILLDEHMYLGQKGAGNIIKKLSDLMSTIIPVKLSEKNAKRFSGNQQAREFKLGNDVVVLKSTGNNEVVIQHAEGGETQIFSDTTDDDFDNIVRSLAQKPKPTPPLTPKEQLKVDLETILT